MNALYIVSPLALALAAFSLALLIISYKPAETRAVLNDILNVWTARRFVMVLAFTAAAMLAAMMICGRFPNS